jgi:hypothetical protein
MTTTPTLDQAETDAEAAKADVNQAEQEVASGSKRVTAAALHKLRDTWRHADLTAQAARKQAEKDRLDARMAGLEKIGAEVDKLAITASGKESQLAAALAEVTAASTRVRQLAGEHDQAVKDLVEAARDLQAEPMAPSGPRPTSAFVAVQGSSTIIHKRARVALIGGKIEGALQQALAGAPAAAATDINPVVGMPEPKRSQYYFRASNGTIHTFDDITKTNQGVREQVKSGALQPLSESEIQAYLEGALI